MLFTKGESTMRWGVMSRMMSIKALCFLAVFMTPFVSQVIAQEAPAGRSTRWLGVTIEPGRLMRATGFKWDHEIRVALPQGYFVSTKTYPVLWVTDGSWAFDEAVNIADNFNRLNIPQMIIVGIGMPHLENNELAQYEKRRIYDFLPSRPAFDGPLAEQRSQFWEAYEKGLAAKGVPLTYGGANAFLSFLIDEVRPALSHDYRTSNQNVLFGYSAGGAFCAYALLTRPEAFQKYICGGFETHEVLTLEAKYARAHQDLAGRVYIGYAD